MAIVWNKVDAVAGETVAGDLVDGDLVDGDTVAGDLVAGDTVVGDTVVGDTVDGDMDMVAGDTDTVVGDGKCYLQRDDLNSSLITRQPFAGKLTFPSITLCCCSWLLTRLCRLFELSSCYLL